MDCAAADFGAIAFCGIVKSFGQTAYAAAGETCGWKRSTRVAKLVMKKIEGGSLLARADKGSKHGASSQGALEQIAFEPFVQQVGDAHGQDPEKVVHLFFAESMKFPSEFQKF